MRDFPYFTELSLATSKDNRQDLVLPECSSHIQELIDKENLNIMRKLGDINPLLSYELNKNIISNWEKGKWPSFALPSLQYNAMDTIDPSAQTLHISPFETYIKKEWPVKYDENGRKDVWLQCLRYIAREQTKYETEAFFRVLNPACTTNNRILSGYTHFNRQLVKDLAEELEARGEVLKYVIISPEDVAVLRKEGEIPNLYADDDPSCRRTLFLPHGYDWFWPYKVTLESGKELDIELITTQTIGIRGEHSIYDKSTAYGLFRGNSNGMFGEYKLENGAVLDKEGMVVKLGESQIYGISSKIKDYLKCPIVAPYKAQYHYDPFSPASSAHPREVSQVRGRQKWGAAILSNICVVMAVVDMSKYDRD
jgi:hypothetical protein